jgi:hypothetical protein
MIARTAITINIPIPIPALNIPPISSQLVNEKNNTTKALEFDYLIFFIMVWFKFCKLKCKVISLVLIVSYRISYKTVVIL